MTHVLELDSPIGPLTLLSDGECITRLHLGPASELPASELHASELHATTAPDTAASKAGAKAEPDPVLRAAQAQLEAYFAGTLRRFELPLRPHGTPFQQRVWEALAEIPFGTTCSYGDIAARLGAPGSARAVGAANGRNPIALIVPCHRVIGASGRLVGYGGGLPRKTWLLEHERRAAAAQLELVSSEALAPHAT